ncbi:MAG: RING finger domain-containing protein [Candidatus Babeliales bacterium]|jgi:hypothetical protein
MNTFNTQNILKAAFGLTLALSLVGSAQCALAPECEKKVASEPEQEEICAICLAPLAPLLVTKTPCNHFFHTACLCQALIVRNACPICRTNFNVAQHQGFLNELSEPTFDPLPFADHEGNQCIVVRINALDAELVLVGGPLGVGRLWRLDEFMQWGWRRAR